MKHRFAGATSPGASMLLLLIGMMLIVPLIWPSSPEHTNWKAATFGLSGVGLVALWLLRLDWRTGPRAALVHLRSGPNLPLALLLGWTALSAWISPVAAYAWEAWLRFACGAAIYVVIAYYLRQREHLQATLRVAVAVAVLAVLAGLSLTGGRSLVDVAGTFQDRQLFGGFLVLMLPVVLGVAIGSRQMGWRLAAQVAALLVLACLLVTRCRSAWVGAAVGLTVFAGLAVTHVWTPQRLRRRPWELLGPVAAVVALFVTLAPHVGDLIEERWSTFARLTVDPSVIDRMSMWSSAAAMILARPLVGFGLGAYPLYLSDFNPSARATAVVAGAGPSLSENAHNFYLQLGAEAGLPAVALYLAMLAAFFVTASRALKRQPLGFRKCVLIGAIAALAGQAVDAVANPAWVFAECSLFFWVVMGVGMAAAGLAERTAPVVASAPAPSSRLMDVLSRAGRLAFVGCVSLWLAARVFDVTLVQAAVADHRYDQEELHCGLDYLGDGVPPPAAFAINRVMIDQTGPGARDRVEFKVYAVRSDGSFIDVTGERRPHLSLSHNGSGRLQLMASPAGGRMYVYTPNPADGGRIVTILVKLRSGNRTSTCMLHIRATSPPLPPC